MAYVVVPIDFVERDKRMRKLMFRFGGRAAALPIRLWCLAAQESPKDGRLAEHSTETLEIALGWTGRRGELELALIEAAAPPGLGFDPETSRLILDPLIKRDSGIQLTASEGNGSNATTFMRKHGGFDSGVQHDPLAEEGAR